MYLIPSTNTEPILFVPTSFQEAVQQLYRAIDGNDCGCVYSDPFSLEKALVVIEFSKLKRLKEISVRKGAVQKILDAMIYFFESKNVKTTQMFFLVGKQFGLQKQTFTI